MGINWKQKLSSRKFWAMLANFVAAVLVVFNFQESDIVQVTAIIAAFGGVVTYLFVEASIDKARAASTSSEVVEHEADED